MKPRPAAPATPSLARGHGPHDRAHDRFLRCLGAGHLGHEAPLVHHADAVAHPQQLRHLRRDEDDALAAVRQRVDDLVDLVFGAHVDAAGRLVQDQHLRVREQPLGQHDLLLVAARQLAGLLVDAGAADAHPAAVAVGHLQLPHIVDDRAGGDAAEVGQGHVLAHVLVQQQAEVLAVLRHVGQPGVDGAGDRGHVHRLAIHERLALDVAPVGPAEHAHRELGPSGAHQPGDADDLAAPHPEIDAAHHLAPVLLRVVGRPILDVEHHLADLGIAAREAALQVAVDHAPYDVVLLDPLRMAIHRLDRAPVAQHGDAVRDLRNLVQLVGDQDGRDALGAQADQQVQQRRAVALVEARGRLVEDQQADLLRQRLRDLHQLLLADAEVAHDRVRRLVKSHLGQQRPGPVVHGAAVDHAEPRGRAGQEDVLSDGHQRDEREFLVDDDDAQRLGVVNAAELPLDAVVDDGALVAAGRVDAAQHLHQRGLAGAVLADEGVYLAPAHRQVHVLQRGNRAEPLGDPAHRQNVGRAGLARGRRGQRGGHGNSRLE